MTLKPWLIAALAVLFVGLGAAIATYVPTLNEDIHVEAKPNSCGITCPAQTAYPSLQGSVSCPDGSAPLCQCTDIQKPMAGCVPVD